MFKLKPDPGQRFFNPKYGPQLFKLWILFRFEPQDPVGSATLVLSAAVGGDYRVLNRVGGDYRVRNPGFYRGVGEDYRVLNMVGGDYRVRNPGFYHCG